MERDDVEKAARAALQALAKQPATGLLIYDNVTEPDEISGLLPEAGASCRAGDAVECAVIVLAIAWAVVELTYMTPRWFTRACHPEVGDSLLVKLGTVHAHWNASATAKLVFTEVYSVG